MQTQACRSSTLRKGLRNQKTRFIPIQIHNQQKQASMSKSHRARVPIRNQTSSERVPCSARQQATLATCLGVLQLQTPCSPNASNIDQITQRASSRPDRVQVQPQVPIRSVVIIIDQFQALQTRMLAANRHTPFPRPFEGSNSTPDEDQQHVHACAVNTIC